MIETNFFGPDDINKDRSFKLSSFQKQSSLRPVPSVVIVCDSSDADEQKYLKVKTHNRQHFLLSSAWNWL